MSDPSRSPLHRVLIGFNAVVLVVILVGVSVVGYGWYRLRQVPTVDLPAPSVGGTPTNEPTSPLDPGGPANYLLIGSDTREGQDAGSVGTTADSGSVNADTILLMRIDPKAQTVDMVSFLRDTWLPIFDAKKNPIGEQRINTALANGMGGLQKTIEQNFDIPIHHTAEVDFKGFSALVDAIGGVEVPLQHSVRDWRTDDPKRPDHNPTGLYIEITEPECRTLNGAEALDYVRSRYFQEFVDGEWVKDRTSDHGRSRRQRDVIQRAIGRAITEGKTSPATVRELFGVADENVTIDDDLGNPARLAAIGLAFQGAPPDAVREHELVTDRVITTGGADVQELVPGPANEAVFDIFRGSAATEPAAPPAAEAEPGAPAEPSAPPGPEAAAPPPAAGAEPADLC